MEKTIIYNSIEFTQIKDFKDYFVSRCGKVLSTKCNNKRILRPGTDTKGYLRVALYKNNKSNTKKVHRLVGQQFISNPLNKSEINHLDGVKTNNSLDNLEWNTHRENIKYSFEKLGKKTPMFGKFGKHHNRSKKVNQYDMDGNFIKLWHSMSDIQRELKFSRSNISRCCLNKQNSTSNFKWNYA